MSRKTIKEARTIVSERLNSMSKIELLKLLEKHKHGEIAQLLLNSNFCLAGQDEADSLIPFKESNYNEFYEKVSSSKYQDILNIGISFNDVKYHVISSSKQFDIIEDKLLFKFDFKNFSCDLQNLQSYFSYRKNSEKFYKNNTSLYEIDFTTCYDAKSTKEEEIIWAA